MKSEFLKHKRVKDQYGKLVTVQNVVGNSVQVIESNDYYHTTKLYYNGKSLYTHLNN